MKKIRLTAVIALMLTVVLCLAGCGEDEVNLDKQVLTPDQFMETMFAEGYNIYDITAQASELEDIETVYAATTGEELYQIEFIKLRDEDAAKALFQGNKTMLEYYKENNPYTDYDLELANFSTYKINVVGKYYIVISRVEDTIVFVNAPEAFTEEIDRIIDVLGY